MARTVLSRGLALTTLFAVGACNSLLGNHEHPLADDDASAGSTADAGGGRLSNAGSSGKTSAGGATAGATGGGADMTDGAGDSAGGAMGTPSGGNGTAGSVTAGGAAAGGAAAAGAPAGGAGGISHNGGAGGTMNGGAGGTITSAGMAGSIAGGGAGPAGGAGGAPPVRVDGPCDIYAAASTKCAAAYSTIRALSKAYNGPLYQVRNGSSDMNTGSGGLTLDIGITADGFANSAAQDTFCSGSTCTVSVLYDQSGNKNDLKVAPAGLAGGGPYAAAADFESSATSGPLLVGGHHVYSLAMAAREGYRLAGKVGLGMPVGIADQGIYMLADGTHYGTQCCWDFGNMSTDPTKYHTSNALFLGTGFWGTGAGAGPWFLGNFEGGLWSGGAQTNSVKNNPLDPSMNVPFAFGILKTTPGNYALRAANLATATDLTTANDGAAPKTWDNQGGIVLGVDSDNGNNSFGTFYEGAITAGGPTDATDLAVMKNLQAAKYGQ